MYPFREGDFAPRNGWYVAALCENIGEQLLSRWILGDPVVLYRKADGEAVTVGWRFPHRYFSLGESCRIGDTIQCGYHRITFGPDGLCTRVPSQKTVQGVYRIPSYPLIERSLWAFIWMGDPEQADEGLIPTEEDMGFGLENHYEPFRTMFVDGRYQLLNDNLLDLTHLSFLHSSSIGTQENASTPEQREMSGNRIKSLRWMRGAACPPLMGQAAGYDGKVERLSGLTFFAPGFHVGLDDTFVVEDDPERGGECIASARLFHAVTPATGPSANYLLPLAAPARPQSMPGRRRSGPCWTRTSSPPKKSSTSSRPARRCLRNSCSKAMPQPWRGGACCSG